MASAGRRGSRFGLGDRFNRRSAPPCPVSVRRVAGQTSDPRQVGREVGVAAVLEGGVRREGNRVRVTARLTNATTGQVMWASEPYDRELADIFTVQSGIALEIAAALRTAMTPEVRRSVERRPTENPEAYNAYLRGMDYYRRSQEERDVRAALASFERAVGLDPRFAAAHAWLSRVHSMMWWFHYDRTPERVALAKAAVDRAVALEPDIPEVHTALGYYYYWCHLDYERALAEFRVALKARPNDSDVLSSIGYVFRRQGKFREAVTALRQAADLDPQNATLLVNLGETVALVRDVAAATRWLDRSIALTPDWARPYGLKGRYLLRLAGDIAGAGTSLTLAASLGVAEDHDVAYAAILLELSTRRYQAGLERLSSEAHDSFDSHFWFVPNALLQAQLHGLLGQREAELTHYRAAAALLEAKIGTAPNDARLHGSLGVAYAGLGRKADAVREGQRALELMPVAKEAYRGAFRVEEMARIYAMVGERDAAVGQLEYLMSIPFDLAAPGLRLESRLGLPPRPPPLPDALQPLTRPASAHCSHGLTVLAPAARMGASSRVTTVASMAAAEAAMRASITGSGRPRAADSPDMRPQARATSSVMPTIRPAKRSLRSWSSQARSRAFLRPSGSGAMPFWISPSVSTLRYRSSSRCSASQAATAIEGRGLVNSDTTHVSSRYLTGGRSGRCRGRGRGRGGRRAGANGRRTRGGCRGAG